MYHQSPFLYIILSCLLLLSSGCSSETQNAADYHQTVQTEVQQTREDYLLLSELLGSRDKSAIQSQVNRLKTNLKQSIKRLQQTPTLSKDFEYKALAIKQLQILQNNLETRYPQIIKLTAMSSLTDEQAEQLETIYEEIEDQEEPIYEQCEHASAQFRKHHRINQ